MSQKHEGLGLGENTKLSEAVNWDHRDRWLTQGHTAMARIQVRALLLIPICGTSLVKSGMTVRRTKMKEFCMNRDKNERFITIQRQVCASHDAKNQKPNSQAKLPGWNEKLQSRWKRCYVGLKIRGERDASGFWVWTHLWCRNGTFS